MASTDPHNASCDGDLTAWRRIAEELRACQERQRRDWGDIDNADLGRYLAGEADEGAAARIEHALEELPELRKLTDLVREVLNDATPVAWEQPLTPASADRPVHLRFAPRPPRRTGVAGWVRRRSPLVAAACLLVVFAAAMPRMSPLAGPREGAVALTNGEASRAGLRLAAQAPVARAAVEHAQPPLTREPRPGDFPSLTAVAFDATKRGFYYLRRDGDLTRAAPSLTRALRYCQANLKPDDPATTYTTRQLADVYQVALNTGPVAAPAPAALQLSPAVRSDVADRTPDQARRESAQRLREQIAGRPIRDVRTTVTPVLAEALRVAPDPKERRRLLRAIGRLGPAAEPAVPVLTSRLTHTTDAAEAREVLAVLDQIGPAGKAALPVLAQLGGASRAKAASRGAPATGPAFRFKPRPEDHRRAAEVYDRLCGRHGQVGVHDRAGVFTVRAAREATRSLLHLARSGGAEVLIETTDGAAAKELKPPARAVIIRIDIKGPAVRAEAGEGLKDGERLSDRARERALACCRKQQYDEALREAVASLTPPAGSAQPR